MPVRAGRGWAYSRQGTASRVFPLRHSFQAVSPTGTLHTKHGCRLRHALPGPEQEISSPAATDDGVPPPASGGATAPEVQQDDLLASGARSRRATTR